MSDSYGVEAKLIELAEKLEAEAADLRRAAEVLATLRTARNHEDDIKAAREWAKSWLKR